MHQAVKEVFACRAVARKSMAWLACDEDKSRDDLLACPSIHHSHGVVTIGTNPTYALV
jgi:hypothetical protein